MEIILIPLALLGLAGGIFNLPAYLGSGLLQSFLAPLNVDGGHLSQATELALQGAASVVALSGIGVAWLYFGRQRREGLHRPGRTAGVRCDRLSPGGMVR